MDKKGILLNHKSIRNFLPRIVDDSIIMKIFNAAIRASNTGNMQLYSIILSTQPKIKEDLCRYISTKKW